MSRRPSRVSEKAAFGPLSSFAAPAGGGGVRGEQLRPPQARGVKVDGQGLVLGAAHQENAVQVLRPVHRLPALQHVVQHTSWIALERIAITSAGTFDPAYTFAPGGCGSAAGV